MGLGLAQWEDILFDIQDGFQLYSEVGSWSQNVEQNAAVDLALELFIKHFFNLWD